MICCANLGCSCRQVGQLAPESTFVACVVAQDQLGNVQRSPVRVPLSTTDSKPPDTTLRVPASSLQSALAGSSCSFTVQASVNEPSHVSYIVALQSFDTSKLQPRDLFDWSALAGLAGSIAAGGNITVSVGEQNLVKSSLADLLSCDTEYQVQAQAQLRLGLCVIITAPLCMAISHAPGCG